MADFSEIIGHRLSADARVVMMCGISGSGKTTAAKMLESKGFVRLSLDGLMWQRYGGGLSSLPVVEKKERFKALGATLCSETCRLVREGHRVVVDATMCKRGARDRMRGACRDMGVEPVIVYLAAPKELLASRLATRRGLGPDDQFVSREELDSFYAGFEVPDADEDAIVVKQ